MSPIVTIDPNVMHGTPCFAGTRVAVQSFFDHLEDGYTVDGFVEQFPTIKKEGDCSNGTTEKSGRTIGSSGQRVKILLDENLPHLLRMEIPRHDVFTTALISTLQSLIPCSLKKIN